MEGVLPSFHAPYIEPEQIIRSLRVSNGEHLPFCTEAAILLIQGTSVAETETLLLERGLEAYEIQEIVREVHRVKKRKVRLNGIGTALIGLFYACLGVGLVSTLMFLMICLSLLAIPGVWFLAVGLHKLVVGCYRIIVA